jgi:hypothetical protein
MELMKQPTILSEAVEHLLPLGSQKVARILG